MNSLWKKRFFIFSALLVTGIIIGLGLSINFDTQTPSLAEKSPIPLDTRNELDRISTALSQVAAAVSPSVVNISTSKKVQTLPLNELYDHPLFRKFFGEPPGSDQEGMQTSMLGSGVIVSSNGHILTNNHVIEGAEEIVITLNDEREFEAELVGADPRSELALVKIDAENLSPLVMNENYELKVGELVIAVGIQFGLSNTVTMGIISALGRSDIGIVDYENFIQTDAAINPGNSGGALVNSGGELIGINTAIFSTSGGNMGVGFAIPVKMAKPVMESLLEHGKVIRGWLGVNIQPITPELAEYFNLTGTSGALISEVMPEGPAAQAGLQQGDIVLEFAGTTINEANTLKDKVAQTSPGSTATIKVIRDDNTKEVEVTIEEYPEIQQQ
ncbi:Do family serine endopeptidase [Desulfopila inferna]|uniref:Do family serine endopeptidase n=1 Tax=Desulfopila inferna TaxID=468528 RepID=UPI001965F9AB|nr:Do family serine endopeptidase [Desulfopila inferna]MBM9606491.1 Do family serine endopeptidase [Desulfopila inferna]